MRFARLAARAVLLIALLGSVSEVSAGKRKQLQQEIERGMAAIGTGLASVGQEGAFCDVELGSVRKRLAGLRLEIESVRPDEALVGRVAELGSELETLIDTCHQAGRDAARQALARLADEALRAKGLISDRAAARDAVAALLAECDSDLELRLPSLIDDGHYQDVIRACQEWPRRLEKAAYGSTCEDDLSLAEYRLGMADTASGVATLCDIAGRTCIQPLMPELAQTRLEEMEAVVRRQLEGGSDGDGMPWEHTADPVTGTSGALQLAAQLAACQPERFAAVLELARQAERAEQAVQPSEHGITARSPDEGAGSAQPPTEAAAARTVGKHTTGPPSGPGNPPEHPGDTPLASYLTLDVWQSAWGDFSDIDELVDYARRNHITGINLNPGQAMNGDLYQPGYRQLRPIVSALRAGGVESIGYLYAELNYDVLEYARFLKQYADLDMHVLVDDSEFTDSFLEHFDRNRRRVQAEGIAYAGFVTVERRGNSGVSDSTRRWAIRHLDQTIMMSYLSCNVPDQRRILEPYLSYADGLGLKGAVKIAILLGGKKVGREVSCELELGEAELQAFLRDLHAWARSHPSYGGLVLESNRRLPRHDVCPEPLR